MLIVALIAVSFVLFISRAGLMNWSREAIRKIHDEFTWDIPGKQETSVEWFREIRGSQNWCVHAAV